MLLECPVEILWRNRTLILSTAALLGGLHVCSSTTASLLCLILTSSFMCLRSLFPVSVSSVSFVPSHLRDNSYSDEISPQQGLWAFAWYPDSLTQHPASSAPAPIGFRNPPTLVSFFDQSIPFSYFWLIYFHCFFTGYLPYWFNWLPWFTLDLGWSWSSPATLPRWLPSVGPPLGCWAI